MRRLKCLFLLLFISSYSVFAQRDPGFEKLFFHLSAKELVSGEILWYKGYLFNENVFRFSEISKVIYLDLVGRDGSSISQQKLKVNNGVVKGSLVIPKNTPTGVYKLLAYSNWMKNGGEELFYKEDLHITNAFNNEGNDNVPLKEQLVIVPESGNLNENIESKVTFVIKNKVNFKDSLSYYLLNNNDTILKSKFINRGSFNIKPLKNPSYTLIVLLENGTTLSERIEFKNTIAINAQEKDNSFDVKIGFDNFHSNNQFTFLVQSIDSVLFSNKIILNDNVYEVSIPKNKLVHGINIVTVFDNQAKQVVCERYIYNKTNVTEKYSLLLSNNYEKRSEVSTYLNTSEKFNIPGFEGSVSVSPLVKAKSGTLTEFKQMLLMKMASETFDDSDYDNWLVLYSSSKIKEKKNHILYPPEIYDHLLKIKVKNKRDVKGQYDATLSIPSNYYSSYLSKSDKEGNIYFLLKDVYGPTEMFLQPRYSDIFDRQLEFDVQSPFLTGYQDLSFNEYHSLDSAVLAKRFYNIQFNSNFWIDSLKKFKMPDFKDTLKFYGVPNARYYLDKYNRFGSVEEVLREYVREVSVINRNGKLLPRVYNAFFNRNIEDNILIMLDGVPLKDNSSIFQYNPYNIKYIDIIPQVFIWGETNYEAIINFVTYEQVFDGYEIEKNLLSIDFQGLEVERAFFHVDHSIVTKDVIPDFRTTLYWNPDFKPNDLIRFFTSDVKGDFLIQVEGVDNNGKTISLKQKFSVK